MVNKYGICKNSLSRKHKWLEKRGKNKDKPSQCIYCNQLKVDLLRTQHCRITAIPVEKHQ